MLKNFSFLRRFIISLDGALLEDMMEGTRFNDNIQTIFPNLVAVIQHRTAVPGTWRVALRRSLSIDHISSMIQTATVTFGKSLEVNTIPPPRYRQLDVRALHFDGLAFYGDGGSRSGSNRQRFDEVVVGCGVLYSTEDHVANAVAAAECQFGQYCALANALLTMSKIGTGDPQRISGGCRDAASRGEYKRIIFCLCSYHTHPQCALFQFRIWATRHPTRLCFVTRIHSPPHMKHSQEDPWDATARFFCTQQFSESITNGTALISIGVRKTSIVYDADKQIIHCFKSLKITYDLVAGPGQHITGSCCGRVLDYTLDLPLPGNRVAWIEPVNDLDAARPGLAEEKSAFDRDAETNGAQLIIDAGGDDAKVEPVLDGKKSAIAPAAKHNASDEKVNPASITNADNIESKSVAPRKTLDVDSKGVAVLSGGGTVMHPARDWGRIRIRVERVDGQQGCDGPARPFSDSEAADAEDWDMI